jgi:hypothetical protein
LIFVSIYLHNNNSYKVKLAEMEMPVLRLEDVKHLPHMTTDVLRVAMPFIEVAEVFPFASEDAKRRGEEGGDGYLAYVVGVATKRGGSHSLVLSRGRLFDTPFVKTETVPLENFYGYNRVRDARDFLSDRAKAAGEW